MVDELARQGDLLHGPVGADPVGAQPIELGAQLLHEIGMAPGKVVALARVALEMVELRSLGSDDQLPWATHDGPELDLVPTAMREQRALLEDAREGLALGLARVAAQERGEPVSPSFRYHLGLALRALGRDAEAVNAFETALAAGEFREADDARRQLEAARHREPDANASRS